MACSDQVNSEDLENAKDDAVTLAEVATSRAGGESGGALIDVATTRLGDTFSTLRGQLAKLGYEVPIAYTAGISFTVDDAAKSVDEGGVFYAPRVDSLPFTTSGTWVGDDDARFRDVSQNNLSSQVATNTADIATNTADIATNTADIATKASLAGDDFTGQITSTAGDLNLKANTALSDADATLTAAQLIGGEFTVTPTADRTLTTDTAANIISALSGSVDGSNFEFTIINLAAFDVTISAGSGVALVGSMVVNDGSANFRVRRLTSSTVSVTRLETGASSLGVGQAWQDFFSSRAIGVNYTNTTGKPISVSVSATTTNGWIDGIVDSVTIRGFSQVYLSGANAGVTFIVPNGSTYSIVAVSGVPTLTYWSELR